MEETPAVCQGVVRGGSLWWGCVRARRDSPQSAWGCVEVFCVQGRGQWAWPPKCSGHPGGAGQGHMGDQGT